VRALAGVTPTGLDAASGGHGNPVDLFAPLG
jgi:hypothetical protein